MKVQKIVYSKAGLDIPVQKISSLIEALRAFHEIYKMVPLFFVSMLLDLESSTVGKSYINLLPYCNHRR